MKNKSLRHVAHYTILLLLMVLGLIITVIIGKNIIFQTATFILIFISYFTWGVIHSAIEGELHSEIILEYLLFGLLGLAMVLGVLYYL